MQQRLRSDRRGGVGNDRRSVKTVVSVRLPKLIKQVVFGRGNGDPWSLHSM